MANRQNSIRIVTAAPRMGRKLRSPKLNFQVRHRPYIVQPTFIHPVLPGETLKAGFMQSTTLTPPIKNGMIGWWMEHHMYYVKHRDLKDRDQFTQMHLDASYDIFAWYEDGPMPANPDMFYSGSGLNWVGLCLERVVDTYFRNEGEDTTFNPATGLFEGAGVLGGMPICSTANQDWLDSAKLADQTPFVEGEDTLPGWIDPEGEDPIYPGYEAYLAQWRQMTATGMVEATFEDYLRSFGISPPKQIREELHRPEQLRWIRKWAEPRNIVAPLWDTGTESGGGGAARGVLWDFSGADAGRVDKDRLFQEPGFLLGLCYARPKVYLSGQVGSATELMTDAIRWLPAILQSEPYTSLLELEPPSSILPAAGHEAGKVSQSVWIDLRDLFMYGEQFVNFDIALLGDGNGVAHPRPDMQRRFVSDADIAGFFPPVPAVGVDNQKLSTEGQWSLQIASRLRDTSERGNEGVPGMLVPV